MYLLNKNFIRRSNRGYFQIGWLIGAWDTKFQLNSSKIMPAKANNTGT